MAYSCTVEQFHRLLDLIKGDGFTLVGPTKKHDVIVYQELASADDLPIGWSDEQEPGYYRLKPSSEKSYFRYCNSPHSWKQFFFPSCEKLWTLKREPGQAPRFEEPVEKGEKIALIGIHSCDLHALFVQDHVFNKDLANYAQYHKRRENTFILVANCTYSVSTCFCTSMGTGPEATSGFDLAVTEMAGNGDHYFLVNAGTERGAKLRKQLELPEATPEKREAAKKAIEKNKKGMKRSINNVVAPKMLMQSWNYKRWEDVATRCINCANCTLACPTCFCSSIQDKVSLDASHIDRIQTWESCFNLSHSYVHGGSVRASSKSRYRQWLTHKFGSWWDQFGESGCVGCGRCITWCPVGIDVTEEINALEQEAKGS